jgi:hypothetical protein
MQVRAVVRIRLLYVNTRMTNMADTGKLITATFEPTNRKTFMITVLLGCNYKYLNIFLSHLRTWAYMSEKWTVQGAVTLWRRLLCPIINYSLHICHGGTRYRSWLRYYAISRKVAGSIPDEIIGIFNLHNSSSRTTALGSTQYLAEMSTRNLSRR